MRGIDRCRVALFAVFGALIVASVLTACGASATQNASTSTADSAGTQSDDTAAIDANEAEVSEDETVAANYQDPGDDYKLEQVVILSRHNIRSPLSTNGSILDIATPHKWYVWTSEPSELSLRGGALETFMGEYVRSWLEHEGLIDHNWQPADGEVRFYANSKQRTIATAQYFSGGFLPVANVRIETKGDFDEMNPVFTPKFTFMSDAYEKAALAQIAEFGGEDGMRGVAAGLADSYKLISDVCDIEGSEGYQSGELAALDTTDTNVVLELDQEPAMEGSLKLATQLSDALVLQYYEESDPVKAGFGTDLTRDQWKLISKAKDVYGDVLFTAPLVAVNVAHPLLQEIEGELSAKGRKFTFLCGHDSNIGSVLAALGVDEYELPNAIEAKTPIGSKLVFEKWANKDGKTYARVRLMYQTTDQLRDLTLLQHAEVPQTFDLTFEGLEQNADGLYAYDDLHDRIKDAIAEYDRIREEYADDDELAEAA